MKETITQEELAKFRQLHNAAKNLEADVKRMRADLCDRFFNDAEVEEGDFRILPKAGTRRPAWKKYVIRLAGEGYVKNVVAHTEPGPPTIEVR